MLKTSPCKLGDSGIYANEHGGAKDFKEDCYEILTKFGYVRNELVIRDNKGEEF